MSYILFAQTSTASGTRNTWLGVDGAATGDGLTGNGVVGSTLLANIAASTFAEVAPFLSANRAAAYDLSGGIGALGALIDGPGATGRVIGGTTNALDVAASSFDAATGALAIGLAEDRWNSIKNVEVRIDSADTGSTYNSLKLANFVDARVKIGDGVGEAGSGGVFTVEVENAKRGQIDASDSDMAVNATINVWTNDAGWQNSFANEGSAFGDVFTITFGAKAAAGAFGRGAGTVWTGASPVEDSAETVQRNESVYNGHLTTLFTNLGAGNDTYDARDGFTIANGIANAAAELMTTDWVWGGTGNDAIFGGGGHDVLFGDFGSHNGVGQSADPLARGGVAGNDSIDGGSGNDWIVGGADLGAIVTQTINESFSRLPEFRDLVAANNFRPTILLDQAATGGGSNLVHTAMGAFDADGDTLFDGWVMRLRNLSGTDGNLDLRPSGGTNLVNDYALGTGREVFIYLPDTPEAATPVELGSVTYIATLDAPVGGTLEFTNPRSSGEGVFSFNGTRQVTTTTYNTGDDLTGGAGNDTFVWNAGDGLDLIRDFTGGDLLRFDTADGLAGHLSTITHLGQESTLVRSSATATDGVILLGVTTVGAGDILWV